MVSGGGWKGGLERGRFGEGKVWGGESLYASILGKECRRSNHINFFRGLWSWGTTGGAKQAKFGHNKFSSCAFLLPLST